MMERLYQALAFPILALRQLEERIYWGYLGGALFLAFLVWLVKLRSRVSLFHFLFPRKIWLHSSALFDVRLMVVRALISVFIFAPLVVSATYVAVVTLGFLRAHSEGASLFFWGPKWGAFFVTGMAFVFEDFTRYWVHRLAHRIPALWQLHQVHHSAAVLTPLTIYRAHPLDALLLRTASSLALGVGAGLGAWLWGVKLSFVEIMGIHALSVVWNFAGSNLRHSHVWLSYPSWLQRILMSPAQHQIHHSVQVKHYDKNFGSILAIWDYLFGSLYQTHKREALVFGLEPSELNHEDTIISSLWSPLLCAFQRLLPVKRS